MPRYAANPILTRKDIPALSPGYTDVSSVFNPGAVRFGDSFLLLLRIQNRGRQTRFLKALSPDGIHFTVEPHEVVFHGTEHLPYRIYHYYDPRITRLEGIYHIITAMDTSAGCHLGWFTTHDFLRLDFKGIVSGPDVRNGVLFPEKIEGCYFRFDRPNAHILENGVKTGSAICCSTSSDLLHWKFKAPVLHGNPYFWDELIGSGPTPIKTTSGWLHIYHGVATHFSGNNVYQAGVSLHDLEQPWKVLGRSRFNFLEPREPYELTGQVPNVVFPSGAIPLQEDDHGWVPDSSGVYIYYGAADTCVGLFITTVAELLEAVRI